MEFLFYAVLLGLSALFGISIVKKVKHRAEVVREITPKEAEVEILSTIEENGNTVIFVSGKTGAVKNLCESIYIPLETNEKGEIRFIAEEFSEYSDEKIEKTIRYYHDTSERYRVFLTIASRKNVLYSIMPFSYAIDEVKEEIQKTFYEIVKVCSEKNCRSILIPLIVTDRLDLSAETLAEYAVKPVLDAAERFKAGKICIFCENERLLWQAIDKIK